MFHKWGWNKDIHKQVKIVVGHQQTFTKGSSKANNPGRKKVISVEDISKSEEHRIKQLI